MKLTQLVVKNAKPKEKPYKLADGSGMYLLVKPGGGKYWRMKYSYAGKERLLSIGVYPQISLQEARQKRNEAKNLLKDGVDPAGGETGSFEQLALEWHRINKPRWTARHANSVWKRVETHLIPNFKGDIGETTPKQVLDAVRKIEKTGKTEMMHRVMRYAANIFRLGVIEGRIKFNPAADLSLALVPHKVTPTRTIKADEIPELLEAINNSDANTVVKLATLLTMHTFVRSTELRGAKWGEFDWKANLWTIPAERMKMKEEHVVPLSRQAIGYFRELKKINGDKPYVFSALSQYHHKHPIISENAINNFLQDIGFGERLVGHGFRSLASTTLNETLEYPPDVIERQLAHRERNKVRAAYNRAQYLKQRTEMMQAWSDYIDG